MSVEIVTRAQWGARAPKYRHTIHTPSPRLWIHHTASEQHGPAGVRAVQDFHMDTRGWSDIAYSFLVDDDGTIFEGRGAGVAGGHTKGDNTGSHAICAIGNLDVRQPTDEQVRSIGELAGYGRQEGWWGAITGGHRDAPGAQTACPGRYLYARIPDLRRIAADPQEDDMPTADEVARATVNLLNTEGTALGLLGFGPTVVEAVNLGRSNYNALARLAKALDGLDGVDVDEAAIAAAVLAGLSPEKIAAAIPDTVAKAVVDELGQRLAG